MPRRKPKSENNAVKFALDTLKNDWLLPYQSEFLFDESQLKIAVKARQIGFSEVLGIEGCLDVLRGESVYYISRSERQAIYLLEKFYKWFDFFRTCGVDMPFEHESRTECRINGVDVKSLTSTLGSEGYTGNIYLDEFALHEDDRRVYESLYPTITWGYKIRIISRPLGQSNLFYELVTNKERFPDFSRHTVDIYRAVADGLPIDIDKLKRNFTDEGFAENYECKFLDESTAYLPYTLLRGAITDEKPTDGECYLGIDVGRKHNLSVIYIIRKLGDEIKTVSIKVYKNLSFPMFESEIDNVMSSFNVIGGGIDAGGIGMSLAEAVNEKYPQINSVFFSSEWKSKMATLIKAKFERGQITIPDDNDVMDDFHSVKRNISNSRVSYESDPHGETHADRFWALALALDAAEVTKNPKITILDFADEFEN